MGEEPWRVTCTGALGLDNIRHLDFWDLEEINAEFGLSLPSPPLLVTFHPVTREFDRTEEYARALLTALGQQGAPIVFTFPNADIGGRVIIDLIDAFADGRDDVFVVPNFGTRGYFSLLAQSLAMVGNSSSGIIESASFKIPVVNIGRRQEGRFAPPNVIHVGQRSEEILEGLRIAKSEDFRAGLSNLQNPYGDGHAAERILKLLRDIEIDDRLTSKPFHDAAVAESPS